jgi:hypothetical protein
MAEEKPTRVSCGDCCVTLGPGERTLTIRVQCEGAEPSDACSCVVVCGPPADGPAA